MTAKYGAIGTFPSGCTRKTFSGPLFTAGCSELVFGGNGWLVVRPTRGGGGDCVGHAKGAERLEGSSQLGSALSNSSRRRSERASPGVTVFAVSGIARASPCDSLTSNRRGDGLVAFNKTTDGPSLAVPVSPSFFVSRGSREIVLSLASLAEFESVVQPARKASAIAAPANRE